MTHIESFENFMARYQSMVFSTAFRLLASEAEAQDVSQEVFLKAYERFEMLSVSPTAGGWLKTVATNLCLNHLSRYRARWRFFSEMAPADEGENSPMPDLPAPEPLTSELESAEQREILEAALQKLPHAQRVPLVLYHFEDQSYEEIAAKLKISLAKVKTDIFRAREALRKRLKLSLDGEEGTVHAEARPARAARPPVRGGTLSVFSIRLA